MKKIIKKFWGIALIVVMLSTMLITASAPAAAANPLTWNTEAIPSPGGAILLACDVVGIGVGMNGTTIYAVTGTGNVYKSTNSGVAWVAIPNNTGMSPGSVTIDSDLVATAADSNDVVVVADTATGELRVTTNGGNSWSDLDTVVLTGGLVGNIVSISVSSEVNGLRYAAVADDGGRVWTRKFGSSWEEWVNATAYAGSAAITKAFAVAFSPNFQADRTLTAVTASAAHTYFELLVFTSTPAWNTSAGLTNYPAEIQTSTGGAITDALMASIALAPDYPGGGEAESIAFIGLEATTATNAGVYRMDDYNSSALKKSVQIYSVAFDGTVVVAGTSGDNVWRSENPLDASPSFLANNTMKGPGGTANVLVAFAGTSVVAGTSGDESAFAVSTDNGKSFADISLIDTTITKINDFVVNADGTKIYMVTSDAAGTPQVSLWRYSAGWQRVLSVQAGDDDYIVRTAPANFDAVYVADTGVGSTKLFRSTAGGDTRWYSRSGPGITDLAVESDNVLYAAIYNSKQVSKSTNGAAYFNDPVDTLLGAPVITNITCISTNNILVGGGGYVSYSTDGNLSWTAIHQLIAGGDVYVTATGLTAGSYIYASDFGGIYMWTVGQETTLPWTWVGPILALPAGAVTTGLTMFGGTVYASEADIATPVGTFMRNGLPWLPELGFVFWSSPYDAGPPAAGAVAASSALRLSTTATYVKVWMAGPTALYSYMDTLVLTAPKAVAPLDGALIPLNAKSDYPYNIVFSWTRPSLATEFTLMIALDPFFGQTIITKAGIPGSYTATQSYTLPVLDLQTLTPGTSYYWTVMASKPLSSGMSAMPGLKFTVQAGEAAVPDIASPLSGATDVGTKPAFSWSPVTGATMYQFQLDTGTLFVAPMDDEQSATTAIRLINITLEAGKTYFWRVRALEPTAGDWSSIGSFTVAVPATPPPTPTITIPPTPTFTITVPPPVTITIPTQPATKEISPAYIWAIIIIGAVLVIAVIALIVRTRRSV